MTAPPTRPGIGTRAADAGALIALHHQLHGTSLRLVSAPASAAEVTRLITDLADTATPLVPALTQTAPAVLAVLGRVFEHARTGQSLELRSELTEAHRLLGHGLRDHGIDPRPPSTPVGEVLTAAFAHRPAAARP